MTDPTTPWLDDVATPVVSNDARLAAVLHRHGDLLERQNALEAALKSCKEEVRSIEERELPDLFDVLGVSEMRDSATGRKLKLDQIITVSLAGEKKAKAIAFLRERDMLGLIENTVSLSFGRGENAVATTALESLSAQYGDRVAQSETVNTNSFKAALKEMMQRGEAIPTDDLGVYIVRKVVIK